ncbi:hypothetical protein [uncultured Pseudacidovorax sp.]|uniref:hypothetical protein n=1 Tax=uncultured Pseudacidovorax sp. TaxID=679313 RepID=UPI0025F4B898|nr:hypothetical protein [uncultured Pseudacidovorax sp.]
MNHQRRLMLAGAGTVLFGLSGCITSRMYEQRSEYTENIRGFFMTSDGNSLVILGKSHHYVFAAPPALTAALKPALHSAAGAAEFWGFDVDGNNVIRGTVLLRLKKDLSPDQQALAKEAGFDEAGSGWSKRVELRGTRYSADRFTGPVSQRFNQDYTVLVREDASPGVTALKVAATPVTVLADGALALGAVALLPVFLVVLAGSRGLR